MTHFTLSFVHQQPTVVAPPSFAHFPLAKPLHLHRSVQQRVSGLQRLVPQAVARGMASGDTDSSALGTSGDATGVLGALGSCAASLGLAWTAAPTSVPKSRAADSQSVGKIFICLIVSPRFESWPDSKKELISAYQEYIHSIRRHWSMVCKARQSLYRHCVYLISTFPSIWQSKDRCLLVRAVFVSKSCVCWLESQLQAGLLACDSERRQPGACLAESSRRNPPANLRGQTLRWATSSTRKSCTHSRSAWWGCRASR